jgi:hypothetical protein
MSKDFPIQHDGRYLRVILPASELDWNEVWRAVEHELEEGIAFAEIIAPSYDDDERLEEVRGLVHRLDERGVDSVVEWEGAVPSLMAAVS